MVEDAVELVSLQNAFMQAQFEANARYPTSDLVPYVTVSACA